VDETDSREFWASRAGLGTSAGTNDLPLQDLEHRIVLRHVPREARVLDLGCGNGMLAISLATERSCQVLGVDLSPEMVNQAVRSAAHLGATARFVEGDSRIFDGRAFSPELVISKRMLINLKSGTEQAEAIRRMMALPTTNKVLLCESSVEGLHALNETRAHLGLPEIQAPWHNHYLSREVVQEAIDASPFDCVEVDFSSAYYFASRVINAAVARDEHREASYEDAIPSLFMSPLEDWVDSLVVAPSGESVGQTRLWILSRTR
jgi:SAM-dependent methyltransferase